MNELERKYKQLVEYISSFGSAVVAFSGGTDSTFLLYAAKDALQERVVAVTASTAAIPQREQKESRQYCEKMGIAHVYHVADITEIEKFSENPPDRCYYCKKAIFHSIKRIAETYGTTVVLEGSNLDDDGDYRPGHRAIRELGIYSPLRVIGFTKQEIREMSKILGVPTWNKPSYACLASRIPYGETITEQKLQMIDTAEQLLLDLGFPQMRVRVHGNLARIEIPQNDFEKLISSDIRTIINTEFKKLGFTYTTMDLEGFRSGSMNETLKPGDGVTYSF